MLRPALALLAGLGITVFIVGGGVVITTLAAMRESDPRSFSPPLWYYAANLTLSAIGAAAGGFTTARVTIGRSFFTVFVLALILLMSGIAPVLRGAPSAPSQPEWYPLALALLGPIGVLAGGALERRRSWAKPAVGVV
jgi:hypothetical protein